jgi:hypothetical protein
MDGNNVILEDMSLIMVILLGYYCRVAKGFEFYSKVIFQNGKKECSILATRTW